MSQVARALLAALATYFVVHAGSLLTGFNPLRDLPRVTGWAVDITIWMAVYALAYGALGRVPRKD
jgi:hypothetical protein